MVRSVLTPSCPFAIPILRQPDAPKKAQSAYMLFCNEQRVSFGTRLLCCTSWC